MTTTSVRLSAEQLEHFHCEGYVMVPDVFNDADLQPAIDEISAVVDEKARELVVSGELSRLYDELPFERRLAEISRRNGCKWTANRWCGKRARL